MNLGLAMRNGMSGCSLISSIAFRWLLQKGKEQEARCALRKVAAYSRAQEQMQVQR
jgi:hypothetical protein